MENEVKTCKRCGRELPESMFRITRWGHRADICSDCEKAKRAESMEAKKKEKEAEAQCKRELKLCDFTPRELMQELARRGYQGELTFTEGQENRHI